MTSYTHFASYGGVFFRKSQTYMKAAFKELSLGFVEAIVLVNVCENPGIIQEKIAYNLALDNASVARSLKQMEAKGLIRRVTDNNNQRTKMVYAEMAGKALKERIDQVMSHWNSIILGSFSQEECSGILSALQNLRRYAIDINIDEVLASLKESLDTQ